jgi:CubicO group peptidase (beta-lactamase class C family)
MRRRQVLMGGAAALSALSCQLVPVRGEAAPLKTDAPVADLTTELQKEIPLIIERETVPGLSIALIRNADVVWTQGFGVKVLGESAQVDENTIFECASLTKPVFAYAVMKLKEEGKIDLDRPAHEYREDFIENFVEHPSARERMRMITPRHLLTHTTGIIRMEQDRTVRCIYVPGRRYQYWGSNYVYLQRVVETITGEPLAGYIHSRVLGPMGMKQSSFIWKPEYETQAAGGHILSENQKGRHRKPAEGNAAASLHSTAGEYAQWMIHIMRPPEPSDVFVKKETLDEMLTPQADVIKDVKWGLGWGLQFAESGNSFWHWGNWGDFQALAIGYREPGLGVVILTNASTGLRACKAIAPIAIGGDHPAFEWDALG